MSDNHDDWMNDPLETDDFINTLEEETKNVPRGSGGCCSFDGCLYVVIMGAIVLIVVFLFINSFTSSCAG